MPQTVPAVARYALNEAGRDFIVGDLHGMFGLLDRLLDRVNFDVHRDRLFSLGDLIDRGPDSPRAAEFLQQSWFHAIRGNHEQMAIDHYHAMGDEEQPSRAAQDHLANGGEWFLGLEAAEQARLVSLFEQLPYAVEVSSSLGRLGLVHADVPADVPWERFLQVLQNTESEERKNYCAIALWSRKRIFEWLYRGETGEPVGGVDAIFFGHTPVDEAIVATNRVYLDTGAFLQGAGLMPARGKLSLFLCSAEKTLFSMRGRRCRRRTLNLASPAANQ